MEGERDLNSLRAQCMCLVELSKKIFLLQESLWSQMLICIILSDALRFFKAVLLLQVQTAVFLLSLCSVSTILKAGRNSMEEEL